MISVCILLNAMTSFLQREEIVQWIVEGGGSMENESWKDGKRKIDFLVVNHGTKLTSSMMMVHVKPVSSHWIRFCLEVCW